MKKQPIKVDKRSKEYKDSQKKLTSNKNIQKLKNAGLLLSEAEMQKAIKSGFVINASDIGKLSKTHYEMIVELQDICKGLDERVNELNEKFNNLETKVG